MIGHDLSVSVGPARQNLRGLEVLIAPSGALKNVLVFSANPTARTDFRAPDYSTKSLLNRNVPS